MPQSAAAPARIAPARGTAVPPAVLFGATPGMRQVRDRLDRLAGTGVPVLITGESGTGKELIARYVHTESDRRDKAFVRINCPAIPANLVESELFGYEQGAFTGASAAKAGLMEEAGGGTAFFDGIGELEITLQSKLLQLLQDGEFARVGGRENRRADARIVCAASRPLEQDVAAGTFRQDLLYRINVVTVHLPPLRERCVDIPALAEYFLEACRREFRATPPPFSNRLRQALIHRDWPGNIRQLQNVIKRYAILGSEEAILAEFEKPGPEPGQIHLKRIGRQAALDAERKYILGALTAHNWNRRIAARTLHISYRALLIKMKQSGLPAKRRQPASTVTPCQE